MFQIIGRLIFASFILIVGCALPLMSRATEDTTPTVIISEINWAGSSLSSSDEWIELTNRTDASVDLSGWTIQGAATSNGTLMIPEGSTIQPYSTFLISNYDELNTKSALNHTPDYVTTGVSLSNSGLLLMLIDATGQKRDSALDGSKPLAGRMGTDGGGSDGGGYASMVRKAPIEDGSLASAWDNAIVSEGFDEEVSDVGSPGVLEEWFESEIEPEEIIEIGPSNGLQEIVEILEITDTEEIADTGESNDIQIPTELACGELCESVEVLSEQEETDPSTHSARSGSNESLEEDLVSSAEEAGQSSETEQEILEPTESDDKEQRAATYPVGTLVINEFVSDATEEWIEILNPYNNVIPLEGWSVRDASGKQTGLPDQLLGMGQFVVLKNPSGKLNNTGDTIELLDPTSVVIDAVTYGTGSVPIAKQPNSLARAEDGKWEVTTSVTMGKENVLSPVMQKVSVENSKSEASNSKKIEKVEVIKEIEKRLEIKEMKEIQGTTGPMTLRLSEIYPNTTGGDLMEEFIEIENFGSEPVPLDGWVLTDAGEKKFSFSTTSKILPYHFLTLSRAETRIALNNTSDTVTLFAPDGSLIDSQTYESPPKGSSYVLIESLWNWTTNITPDEPNSVTTDEVDEPARVATASTYRKGVKAVSSWIEGVVLVGPGVFGKQIFYLMTKTGGLQIYKYDGDFPDMEAGDQISVSGTFTESRGERRLKIGSSDEILITGSGEPIDSESIELASLSEADHGRLVTVTGTVVSRTGKKIVLESNGVQLTIRVADGTSIDAATFARGAEMEVTGLVVATNKTITLLPRKEDDVVLTPPPIAEQTIITATGKETRNSTDRSIAFAITILTILGLALYTWIHLIPKWKLFYAKHRTLRAASQTSR